MHPNETFLLARYKENCDQARHHETLREKSTAVVAQTTGIVLGLLALRSSNVSTYALIPIVSIFIVLLGSWGIFSSIVFNNRARRHRDRISQIVEELYGNPSTDGSETTSGSAVQRMGLNWIWVTFHGLIVILGLALYYNRRYF